MKKILIVSTSPRLKSNSEALAKAFARGAQEAGHETELISLRGKTVNFCRGCFVCQEKQRCVTPIYYYEMSGQLKTLLDRLNPLFPSDYAFRDVYLLTAAAESEETVPQRAVKSGAPRTGAGIHNGKISLRKSAVLMPGCGSTVSKQ